MTEYMNQIFDNGSQCALLSRFKATSRGCLHTHLNGGHLWTVETWFTPLKTALMDRIYQPRNKPLTPKHIFLFEFSVSVFYYSLGRYLFSSNSLELSNYQWFSHKIWRSPAGGLWVVSGQFPLKQYCWSTWYPFTKNTLFWICLWDKIIFLVHPKWKQRSACLWPFCWSQFLYKIHNWI